MLFPEMIEKGKLRSLLTSEQLKTKDEELFVIRVPKSIEKSALRNFEFNVKSPERIKVDDKVFSPILDKDVKSKSVILANEKGNERSPDHTESLVKQLLLKMFEMEFRMGTSFSDSEKLQNENKT